ncbi:MAG: ATP-binding protein [Bacteroidia bacterium]|nr:ATP-binding protein [Bacteroidia bacterium]
MIKRDAERELRNLAGQFKTVAVVGPRQSGKTTLARHVFRSKPYVNLENPDDRQFAADDPRGFISRYRNGAIIDEIQRVPDLFSYLQQVLDEDKTKGKFILTGSNNFLLQESISQSLAGRIAYLYLLPFTVSELPRRSIKSLSEQILKGCYPPLYDQDISFDRWYPNYIRTYVERDVRQIKNISDLNTFGRFIRLCAGRTGQLLNVSSLALDTGADNKTISSWLGILENSFISYRLYPHHRNFNKRVVKMPKLYFYDSGLVCSLLGIHDEQQLTLHPLYGNIFETFIVSELKKHFFNKGINANLFFWRDNTGHEIDVLIEKGRMLFPVEIKSGQTITGEFFKAVEYWKELSGTGSGAVVYSGDTSQMRSNNTQVVSWKKLNAFIVEF